MASVERNLFYDGQLEDGTIVRFVEKSSRSYYATKFSTEKEANSIYDALNEHPCGAVAKTCPPMQVGGSVFLFWERLGESLENIDGQKLFRNHLLTPLYQKILRTLFSVLKYMIDNDLEWEAKLENIFIAARDKPLVTLVGLKQGNTDLAGGCKKLGLLIENINLSKNYLPGENIEMKEFLECLRQGNELVKSEHWNQKIRKSPLFWKIEERRDYVYDIVGLIKINDQIFERFCSPALKNFDKVVSQHLTLRRLMSQMKQFEEKMKQNRGSKSLEKSERLRACLFVRNCFSHFYKGKLEHEDRSKMQMREVQFIFEDAFPDFVTNFMQAEIRICSYFSHQPKLAPAVTILEELFLLAQTDKQRKKGSLGSRVL